MLVLRLSLLWGYDGLRGDCRVAWIQVGGFLPQGQRFARGRSVISDCGIAILSPFHSRRTIGETPNPFGKHLNSTSGTDAASFWIRPIRFRRRNGLSPG